MKKTALLHSEISYLLASLGHQDLIVIADSGLPIPKGVKRIDLALTAGVPGFIETLEVVLSELHIEKAWIAEELLTQTGTIYPQLLQRLADTEIGALPHVELKQWIACKAVAVIRTGECSPYANVILQSGVVF
jgi:D-ribose pyranase